MTLSVSALPSCVDSHRVPTWVIIIAKIGCIKGQDNYFDCLLLQGRDVRQALVVDDPVIIESLIYRVPRLVLNHQQLLNTTNRWPWDLFPRLLRVHKLSVAYLILYIYVLVGECGLIILEIENIWQQDRVSFSADRMVSCLILGENEKVMPRKWEPYVPH